MELLMVVMCQLDNARLGFNSCLQKQEAWQIVSYSISLCCLISWLSSIFQESLFQLFQKAFNKTVRTLPWVKRKLAVEMEKIREEMEEDVHQYDKLRDFYKFLPEKGLKVEEIVEEAEQYVSMTSVKQTKLSHQMIEEQQSDLYFRIHELFHGSDPTKSNIFPGVRKMETEIVRMISSMFHGSSVDSCGVVAGEASETILLAALGCRNAAYEKGITNPTILAPETAHPILDQAARLFKMSLCKISVNDNGEFDPNQVKSGSTENIVISAPNHVTGNIDPIVRVAEIAHDKKIPLHIDCTAGGGFLLPFMEYCDFSLPSFDFRLPGVTSISVDLRNYGQSPSSCSVLLYRDSSFLKYQSFARGGGQEGLYWTSTINGTRDGGAVALAWATLLSHGRDGYLNECQKIVLTTRELADMLLTIDGLCLKGSAELCLLTFGHEKVDIFDLVDYLQKKGWDVTCLIRPKAARVSITRAFCEDGIPELFVRDVASAVIHLMSSPSKDKKSRLSKLYTMLSSVSDQSLLDEVAYQRLLAQYSMPPVPERRTRTLSVEGRKMSFIEAAEAARLVNEVRARQEVSK